MIKDIKKIKDLRGKIDYNNLRYKYKCVKETRFSKIINPIIFLKEIKNRELTLEYAK